MSLQLYTRVLWRFRYLVAGGFALAVVIAIVSYATTPSATYQAEARLFVTSPGFPIGTAQERFVNTGGTPTAIGDPTRLTDVASLYAELASSDVVRRAALAGSPVKGKITAQVESTPIGTLLPVVDVQAAVHSYGGSMILAERAARAFQRWVTKSWTAGLAPSTRSFIPNATVSAIRLPRLGAPNSASRRMSFRCVRVCTQRRQERTRWCGGIRTR